MAIAAGAKSDSGVARLFVLPGRVALLAGDLGVQTRKRIAGKRMVEPGEADCLPVVVIVTLQAVGPEPSLVLVLMAVAAARGHSEECPAQILDFDGRAFALGHAHWRVAPVTSKPGVFAFEPVAGLAVIESPEIPFCQDEVLAVVLGMAVHAFQARTRLDVVSSVQPVSRPDAPRNFAVAI